MIFSGGRKAHDSYATSRNNTAATELRDKREKKKENRVKFMEKSRNNNSIIPC